MTTYIGQLYHWSPKDRRLGILQNGLQLMSKATVGSVAFPWVCLATTPSCAWGLTLAEDRMEVEVWDLWQVTLTEKDHVNILSDWGPAIREVRIHNGLPSDRLWWIGERDCHAGIALQQKETVKRMKRKGRK